MTILSVLAAILMLGLLIVAHEFGHFISARLTGIAVQQFSVGFGPKLVKWKSKKYETEFMVRAIPLGGYCMFYGEDDAQGKHQDDPRAYNRQKVWKRMLSVLMGPGMNFILAIVVAVGIYAIIGVQGAVTYIASVDENSPAAAAGMMVGDVLYAINGQSVQDGDPNTAVELIHAYREGDGPMVIQVQRENWKGLVTLEVTPAYDEAAGGSRIFVTIGSKLSTLPFVQSLAPDGPAAMAGLQEGDMLIAVNGQDVRNTSAAAVEALVADYQSGEAPLVVEMLRGGSQEPVALSVTPGYNEQAQRYELGAAVAMRYAPNVTVPLLKAVKLGYDYCIEAGGTILNGLMNLIFKGEGWEESSGPVGIVTAISQVDPTVYPSLLVLLSMNLGLFNLLPIPGLDGSRLLFMLVEVIFRRPINRKAEAVIHLAGFALLMGVMLLLTFKDIQRLF